MRGSCPQSAAEGELSLCGQTVAQIEGADAGRTGVREVREAPVAAHPLLARGALVGLLDREGAARERLAGQLQRPVATPALGLLEELEVDLRGKHRLRAAHVAAAAQRVVVEVQRRALRLHTRGGRDHAIAV